MLIEPRTAMTEAFAKAGLETDRARLNKVMVQAIENVRGNVTKVQAEFLRLMVKEDDAALYRELCASHLTNEALRLFHTVVDMARKVAPAAVKRDDGKGGHHDADTPRGHASRPVIPTPARAGEGADPEHDVTHPRIVRPSPNPSRVNLASIASVAATVRKSLLDTFLVNGRPIGEVTAQEASSWAKSRERDARFVRLLTDGLPPDAVIGKCRSGAEAETIYRLAQEAANV